MRAAWISAWVAVAWLQVPVAEAQVVDDASASSERPRVGLVLGGGAAKGAAHIGVLKVLEEMRVPVDCIAGTSMGALVGGTYAAGNSAQEIEARVRGVDWGETLGSQGLRDLMPIEEKLAYVNYSNSFEFGITSDGFRGRAGLIASQAVEGLLDVLVSDAQFVRDFDNLPIPYRAVATDIMNGEMVVLDHGNLAAAMRASMAIPGVFSPVELEGRLLADGGVVRNVPVDVARELCADVVIAIWMESPPPDPISVRSTVGMFNQMLSVMIGANEREQIDSLTDEDIGIAIPVGDIGRADFQRAGDAIDLGEATGNRYRAELARLSLSESEYAAWERGVHRPGETTFTLGGVEVLGTERVNPAYVESQLDDLHTGATITTTDIVEDMQRVYALGDFERVDYSFAGTSDAPVLQLHVSEKSWGPNFLTFDYGLASGASSDINAILRVDHERTWTNRRGGRWHNALQFGRETLASSNFYQPLDVAQRFFVQPTLTYQQHLEDLYLDDDRAATFKIREAFGQFDVGLNIGTRMQMKVGLRYGWQSGTLETGLPGLDELDGENDASVQFRMIYDTRDVISLPTRGTFFSFRYAHSQPWFNSELDYSLGEAVLSQSFNLGGNSFSLIVGGAQTFSGTTPVSQLIELGGIRTFPGLRPGELRGEEYWFAGTSYSWRVAELMPILGQALFAGVRVQAGQVRNPFDTSVWGISGSLGGRTPIGPVQLSLGWVKDRQVLLQFMLGRPVPEGSLLDDLN